MSGSRRVLPVFRRVGRNPSADALLIARDQLQTAGVPLDKPAVPGRPLTDGARRKAGLRAVGFDFLGQRWFGHAETNG